MGSIKAMRANSSRIGLSPIFIISIFLLTQCTVSEESINYEDPESWGGYCGIGQNQSPINIITKMVTLCPNIRSEFKFLPVTNPFEASDMAFTIQSPNSAYVAINDSIGEGADIRLYTSLQYHFHVPAEHIIDGAQYPM
jgi:carbonic anhydrase